MIGYVDIKKAVIDQMNAKVKNISVLANEELSGFKPPAFFVQIIPVTDTPYLDYEEKLLTVNIHYFSAEKTDLANLKMLDQLNLTFFNLIRIGERTITLQHKRHQIIDNVLQFKFDLEFLNDVDVVQINGEWVLITRLDDSLGYTEDTVQLVQDIEIKEV
ncbi:hypothetical protein DEAC_c14230 [Desulfosporosinus acididurans]|uniref:Uncharacterized protein n=1 Tax=Desulfosporosinus acididurans TaxID=476652 RepID=A0A0J1FTF2_9FIRM|nr:hypothetical protein [Desulfosporosinus acididurans]KLU66755.1 hypothetical protein DEAC_c14230 [Desulfosporosinus acididurans]